PRVTAMTPSLAAMVAHSSATGSGSVFTGGLDELDRAPSALSAVSSPPSGQHDGAEAIEHSPTVEAELLAATMGQLPGHHVHEREYEQRRPYPRASDEWRHRW